MALSTGSLGRAIILIILECAGLRGAHWGLSSNGAENLRKRPVAGGSGMTPRLERQCLVDSSPAAFGNTSGR